MSWRKIGLISVLSLLVFPLSAEEFVHAFELKNGMRLLVREDHRAPVVVSQVWYKVGSSYEYEGITGVSHVLEHMMFKGTKRFGPKEFSRIIKENGGNDNAFTGRDYTSYFQTLEKSRLNVSMELEADRMRNLMLQEAEFKKELEVVKEERRMRTDDNPRATVFEHFSSVAFSNSTYKNPIIGWMTDLDDMTLADLQHWYQRWYAPNNATLVVVGDVDVKQVYAMAEKYFGGIERVPVAPLKSRKEIKQLGKRELTVRAPANVPYLVMGYKVPVLKSVTQEETWEPYALEVLAGVLGGTRSSRLNKFVVRQNRVAVSADVDYNMTSRLSDMFIIDATPASGKSVAEVKQALLEQIEKIKSEPVTEAELERIKTQVVAQDVYKKDSMFYQAMELGILETVGLGYKDASEYVARIRKVTPEQIQKVAQKYLIEDGLTIAQLDPQPLPEQPRKAVELPAGHHH